MMVFIAENMAPIMFASMIIFLLIGYPVAFALAANGLLFFFIGVELAPYSGGTPPCMVRDSDPRGSPVAIGTSAPLHVPQTLDDLSVPDAHDVDASNPVRFALAPAKLPADDPAVTHSGDFLSFEDKVGG